MASYGSHYRVDTEEGTSRHATYDSGVAEIVCEKPDPSSSRTGVQVQLVRVGVLKNILVLNYANLNVVVMVVSWVKPHTEENPRLRRDDHGFWLTNLSATPRDTTNPYLLPALASQVEWLCSLHCLCWLYEKEHRHTKTRPLTLETVFCRYSLWLTRPCQGGLLL